MTSPPSDSFARAPATEIKLEACRTFVFDRLAEVNRLSVAALVALGAEDHELTHQCLSSLVADIRSALRAWDDFRADLKAATGSDSRQAG